MTDQHKITLLTKDGPYNLLREPHPMIAWPRFAVLPLGHELPEGAVPSEETLEAEIAAAADHELSQFLNCHGKASHRWDPHTHIFSKNLRNDAFGCPHCGNQIPLADTVFFHQAETVSATLTTVAGELLALCAAHTVLPGMRVASKLVPQGARVEHLMPLPEGTEARLELRLALPAGTSAADIQGGVDEDAQFLAEVTGHTLADGYDDYHQRFHEKGRGRIVHFTAEEKRAMALDLVRAGKRPPELLPIGLEQLYGSLAPRSAEAAAVKARATAAAAKGKAG